MSRILYTFYTILSVIKGFICFSEKFETTFSICLYFFFWCSSLSWHYAKRCMDSYCRKWLYSRMLCIRVWDESRILNVYCFYKWLLCARMSWREREKDRDSLRTRDRVREPERDEAISSSRDFMIRSMSSKRPHQLILFFVRIEICFCIYIVIVWQKFIQFSWIYSCDFLFFCFLRLLFQA